MATSGSLRCSTCGINYPPISDFLTCPIHDEATEPDPHHGPDKDWRDKAQRLWRQLKEAAAQAARPFPRIEGVQVYDESGLFFVNQSDLIRAGLRIPIHAPSFQLFELEGFVWETQGWDEGRRRWWVEKVSPALVIADKTP